MTESLPELFKTLSQGVYVIGVSDGVTDHAFTAAWVMQVSFAPPLLALSINHASYSYRLLQAGRVCTVNVLAEDQLDIAGHFGRSGLKDKMSGFEWRKDQTTAPVLSAALVYFDCRLSHCCEAGDHIIAVCEVVSAGRLNQGRPLLYSQTGDMDKSAGLYKDEGSKTGQDAR